MAKMPVNHFDVLTSWGNVQDDPKIIAPDPSLNFTLTSHNVYYVK
jgi:hypothetical protein